MSDRSRRLLLLMAVLLLASFVFAQGKKDAKAAPKETKPHHGVRLTNFTVTPVEGPSWLLHLGRPMLESSMGITGRWEPAGTANAEPETPPYRDPMVVSGADLYRLDCQSCHQASGKGWPPEINAIIDPVRATSPALLIARMKQTGAPVSSLVANQLASQSRESILTRLHQGGVNMPAFEHLNDEEIKALMAYLDLLVGVPGAQSKQMYIEEPADRVGEHLVKGTCHICHSATGPNPTPDEILKGSFPPLSTLPQRVSEAKFAQKVTQGSQILMGPLSLPARGRMPVFFYIHDDEAAAAYMYLKHVPPK